MENPESISKTSTPSSWLLVSVIIIITLLFFWLLETEKEKEKPKDVVKVTEQSVKNKIEPAELLPLDIENNVDDVALTTVIESEPEIELEPIVEQHLPSLNDSDTWLQVKLPDITWRKELLKLLIDDDMIRRFVVFTDNFSQGILAYKYSPFILPQSSFSAQKVDDSNAEQLTWQWDEKSEQRFTLYVDLLRSLDSEILVSWYIEMKPLIDQAYAELGYPDDDFTDTLQSAITRVLDLEFPKVALTLVRPSVMYKFKDPALEDLDDVDKLLLRLGKANVLVIKSVLLEFSEKLSRIEA